MTCHPAGAVPAEASRSPAPRIESCRVVGVEAYTERKRGRMDRVVDLGVKEMEPPRDD
jgi:hypothetical protein